MGLLIDVYECFNNWQANDPGGTFSIWASFLSVSVSSKIKND
jgi:hypothetical protein